MRRYRVTRRDEAVCRILDALGQSGARVVSRPDSRLAPFEITIETPQNGRLELICYAFTANKYTQRRRPDDEHRFQVKYGSDSHGYHEIYFDSSREKVTLFFGVGTGEDAGLFVACDPTMHNPTRFFRSIEFKTHHLDEARATGWYGWERDRSPVRRKLPMPEESVEVEALLAFTPENFLRYVELERFTTGLAPGERLLIADRMAPRGGEVSTTERVRHELEVELGYSASEILDLIGGAFRLRAAARGAAAERHLEESVREVPGITRVTRIDEDGRPDLELVYRGRRRHVLVECKNVLRTPTHSGAPRVDFQKTRASKRDPCSRYYRPEQFDILAACLHPVSAEWIYRFRWTRTMAEHRSCRGHLDNRVVVEGTDWTADLPPLLDRITAG